MWNLGSRRDTDPARGAPGRVRGRRHRLSLAVLRVSLAVVFVWFGALKVAGISPVARLVAETVPWAPGLEAGWFVPLLGVFEVGLGLGLLLGRGLRLLVPVLVAHLTAVTLAVLAAQSGLAFQQGNPMLLTTDGEFVIKNLVLAAAALVIGASASTHRPHRRDQPVHPARNG